MRLVLRKKIARASLADVLPLVESAKARGITAREAAKKLGGIDPVAVMPTLFLLLTQRKVWSQFTPCPDWRDHYAVQESRYYMVDTQADKPDEDDPRPKRKLNQPKPKLVLRRTA